MAHNRSYLDPITGKKINNPVRLNDGGQIVEMTLAKQLGLQYTPIKEEKSDLKKKSLSFSEKKKKGAPNYLGDPDYLYKICILGSAGDSDASGTGSESLMIRFADGDYYREEYLAFRDPGIEYKIRTLDCDESVVKLQIWPSSRCRDFRFKLYDETYPEFLLDADGIMLTVDLTNTNLKQYVTNKVALIKKYSKASIILVGTKSDLIPADRLIILEKQLNQLADKLQLEGSIVVSAKTNTRVDEAFDLITECCLGTREYQKKLIDYLTSELSRQVSGTEKYDSLKNIFPELTARSYKSPDKLRALAAKIRLIVSQHNDTGAKGFFSGNFLRDPDSLRYFNEIFDEENNLKVDMPHPELHSSILGNHFTPQPTKKNHTQSKSSLLNNLNKIALLDVDGTIKIKRRAADGQSYFGINKNLIETLKTNDKNEVKDIFFFTNMELSDMENIPISQAHNYITRRQLDEFCKVYGITVHGVITQADVEYKQGLGAAYRDFYEPAYDECLTDSACYKSTSGNPGSYKAQYDDYKEKLNKNPKFEKNIDKSAAQKKLMFLYFKEMLKNNKVLEITYYDDSQACLNAIAEVDPNVKTILVADEKNTPLLIPFQKVNQFNEFLQKIGNGDTSNASMLTSTSASSSNSENPLYFMPIPGDISRKTVSEIKKSIQAELEMTKVFCYCFPEFHAKFSADLVGVSAPDFISNLEYRLEGGNDIYVVRRKLITQISAMLDSESELYKKIGAIPAEETENNLGFNLKSTNNFFYAFPELRRSLIPSNTNELRGKARFLLIELEQRLSLLKKLDKEVDKSNLAYKEGLVFLTSNIKENIENGPQESFFSGESEKSAISLYYIKNIYQIGQHIFKCDEQINLKQPQFEVLKRLNQ